MLLSRTYRPSPDLALFIGRYYVFEAELPDELVIEDFLLSETAFIRVLIKGDWAGEIAPQVWSRPGRSLFFGANALPFKVRVKGSFSVTRAALRPSGWRALFHASHQDYADRLLRLDEVWQSPTGELEQAMDSAADDAGKIAALEAAVRAHAVDHQLLRRCRAPSSSPWPSHLSEMSGPRR